MCKEHKKKIIYFFKCDKYSEDFEMWYNLCNLSEKELILTVQRAYFH